MAETVASAASQSRPPDEMVLVDNSTDPTVENARAAASEYGLDIEVFDGGSNPASARNVLLDVLTDKEWDVMLMVDASREITDGSIEGALDFMDENPEYDALVGIENSMGPIHYEPKSPADPNYFRHAIIFMRRGILERLGEWDESLDRGEDFEMGLRMHMEDVRVMASTKWGDRGLARFSRMGMIRKIWRNPTSLPFVAKHGAKPALIHPAQITKDISSIVFYMALAFTGIGAALFASLFIITENLYQRSRYDNWNWQLVRPAALLVLSTPAMLREAVKLAIRGGGDSA